MVCAAALAALAAIVRVGITHELDRAGLQATQSVANAALDVTVNLHTLVGLSYVTLPLAGALALALHRRGHRAAALAPLLIAGTVLVELALKLSTDHAPPGPETSRAFLLLVPSFETPSSFPSGHASAAFFAAGILTAATGRGLAPVWYSTATVVAASRAYVRIHHPSDVAGGAAVGALLGIVGLRVFKAVV